ncbi:MAG: alpha/beta hydrolase family esterase [Gemmatimonadaceae bacterium]
MLLALALLAPVAAPADTIDVGGIPRTYTAQLPDKASRVPLVLVLHGNTQQGIDMRERTGWADVATKEGFAVVFPDGLNRAWADLRSSDERAGVTPPKGTDDTAFLMALTRRYVENGTADPKHLYVTGVSNGGAMAMTLACEHPETFAAAGIVVMNLTQSMRPACRPSQPIPILLMNGTADPLIPYNGGKGTSRFAVDGFLSTPETVRFWRKVDGCDEADASVTALPDVNAEDESRVTRIESRCPPGRDVVLYRVDGGGHRMPGTKSDARVRVFAKFVLGPQNRDLDGAGTIWAFFRNFAKP